MNFLQSVNVAENFAPWAAVTLLGCQGLMQLIMVVAHTHPASFER